MLLDGIAVKVEDIRKVFLRIEGADKCWYLRATASNTKDATTLLLLPSGSPLLGAERSPHGSVSHKDWVKAQNSGGGVVPALLVPPVLETFPVEDDTAVIQHVSHWAGLL